MESLLERGEKLDDLVAKSEHLGNQSKAFYKTVSEKQNCQHRATGSHLWLRSRVSTFNPQARKQNSCCQVMWCHCLVLMDTPLYAFLLFLQLPSCLQWLNQWTKSGLWKWEGFIARRGWGWRWRVTSADCSWLGWGGGLKMLWGCSGVEVIFV